MQESIVRSVKALVRETDAAGKPTAAARAPGRCDRQTPGGTCLLRQEGGVLPTTLEVLARSDDLAEIPRTIRAAQSFGPAAGRVLRFAGPDVVRATERAGAQGVLEAAKFGPRAVSRLQKTPRPTPHRRHRPAGQRRRRHARASDARPSSSHLSRPCSGCWARYSPTLRSRHAKACGAFSKQKPTGLWQYRKLAADQGQ